MLCGHCVRQMHMQNPGKVWFLLLLLFLPSPRPLTGGSDSLSLNKATFAEGEDIVVKFRRPSSQATRTDWIGIYSSSVSKPDGNPKAILWLYVCNSKLSCLSRVSSGQVTFGSATAGNSWPLPAGSYNAWYMDNDKYSPVSTTPPSPITFTIGTGVHCAHIFPIFTGSQ